MEENRIINGETQYFLKWEGYDDSHNTWEPEENLKCNEMIKIFEKGLKDNGRVNPPTIDDLPPSTSGEKKKNQLQIKNSHQQR